LPCPACGEALAPHGERCPSCGAVVAPRIEGALAPRTVTPPPRDRGEPERDLPGVRRREKSWRDEVRERVRSRRQKRAATELPLFTQPEVQEAAARKAPGAEPATSPSAAAPVGPSPAEVAAAPGDYRPADLSEAELADLPLQAETSAGSDDPDRARFAAGALPADLRRGEEPEIAAVGKEEPVELRVEAAEAGPLERPARPAERAQAALVDVGLLAGLWTLVAYFASRAARVEVAALASSWPWLAAYLGFLGFAYAAYFTGTTGQTPGKMITHLRVVDGSGRPPGYPRALARAILGVIGTTVAGVGLLTMAFDPAVRALHDRLFRTRVVRR